MANSYRLPWQDPDWTKQVHEWIHAEAARHSIQITDPIEQSRQNPWSTVLIVPTTQEKLFFKATAPDTRYEATLTQMLAERYPDCLPEVVAIDATQGWMLVRDSGEPLRSTIRSTQNIQPWEPVITRYAGLQINMADHISEVLDMGVPDHRLEILPSLFSQLMGDEGSMMIGHEKGLTSAERQQIQDLAPRFPQLCTELAGLGIPASLNHGDLHDANILVKNGRNIFFDWGDATITHPFVSLRTHFVSIEMSLKLEEYSFTPEMERILEMYLRSWKDYAPWETLRRAYQLSKPIATATKAIAWHKDISLLDDAAREEYAWIVPDLFREFLYHMNEI